MKQPSAGQSLSRRHPPATTPPLPPELVTPSELAPPDPVAPPGAPPPTDVAPPLLPAPPWLVAELCPELLPLHARTQIAGARKLERKRGIVSLWRETRSALQGVCPCNMIRFKQLVLCQLCQMPRDSSSGASEGPGREAQQVDARTAGARRLV